MIQACILPGYSDLQTAKIARHALSQRFNVNASCGLCEQCDEYHVTVKTKQYPVKEEWVTVLKLLAQGHENRTIARIMGTTPNKIWHLSEKMRAHFYALNTTNLIAIVISLGIVNPKDFVPPVTEKEHS